MQRTSEMPNVSATDATDRENSRRSGAVRFEMSENALTATAKPPPHKKNLGQVLPTQARAHKHAQTHAHTHTP